MWRSDQGRQAQGDQGADLIPRLQDAVGRVPGADLLHHAGQRSAGAGVRIYLPMIGMMGIDWAYGFDKVFGEKGGSHFHFILGQEF